MLERSALSPIETNEDSPIPRAAASSIAAIPNAPLWDAKATLPGVGVAGREGRVERGQVVEVGDPEAVRADHPHAGRPADGEQLVLARTALGSDLGEAGREHDERAHALGGALAGGLEDGGRGHGDDRELDVALDVGDASARSAGRRPRRRAR